ERPLLVGAEPAMLAEADLALVVRRILHDRAITAHPVRVGAIVAGERHRDPHRAVARQSDCPEPVADEYLAHPILGREEARDPGYAVAVGLGEIEGRGGAVGS